MAQGKLEEALRAYRDGLAIGERVAAVDPANARWRRDLSVSYGGVGDVLVARGKLDEALKAYRAARGRRAARRPRPQQHRVAARAGVPSNRVGDVLVAQGQLDEALIAYRDGSRRLRAAGRRRPQRRPMAARFGDHLRQGRRRAGRARQARRGAGGLPGRPRDPGSARGLRPQQRAVAAGPVGRLREGRRCSGAQGKLDEALAAYREAWTSGTVSVTDRGNAQWQRDLSISRKGRRVLWRRASRRRRSRPIGKASPSSSASPRRPQQRRVAARPFGLLLQCGRGAAAQGKLDEALKAYRDRLEFAERLAPPIRATRSGSTTC